MQAPLQKQHFYLPITIKSLTTDILCMFVLSPSFCFTEKFVYSLEATWPQGRKPRHPFKVMFMLNKTAWLQDLAQTYIMYSLKQGFSLLRYLDTLHNSVDLACSQSEKIEMSSSWFSLSSHNSWSVSLCYTATQHGKERCCSLKR